MAKLEARNVFPSSNLCLKGNEHCLFLDININLISFTDKIHGKMENI